MDKETRTNNTSVKDLYEEVQDMERHNPFEETTKVKDSRIDDQEERNSHDDSIEELGTTNSYRHDKKL